jgi:hypothetical protein
VKNKYTAKQIKIEDENIRQTVEDMTLCHWVMGPDCCLEMTAEKLLSNVASYIIQEWNFQLHHVQT